MDTHALLNALYVVEDKDPAKIFETAKTMAVNAATEYNNTLPPENQRGFDWGFAWVVVHPARGPFVSWCKKNKHGSKHYAGGYEFWYSEFSIGTQSIGVHERAARVFCDVLKANGLEAFTGSRLD